MSTGTWTARFSHKRRTRKSDCWEAPKAWSTISAKQPRVIIGPFVTRTSFYDRQRRILNPVFCTRAKYSCSLMRVQEYLKLLELTLSKRTVERRGFLPFAQGFACGPAGLSEFSLNSSFCCPPVSSTFSSLRLSLGHGPNTRVLQLRAFRLHSRRPTSGTRDPERIFHHKCQTGFWGRSAPLSATHLLVDDERKLAVLHRSRSRYVSPSVF